MPNLPRLTPFRALGFALLCLASSLGCSSTNSIPAISAFSPVLLFDREPSSQLPDQYAFRFDDRRVRSTVALDENVLYRESLYDVQGGWYLNRDYYSRRFRTITTGWGSR